MSMWLEFRMLLIAFIALPQSTGNVGQITFQFWHSSIRVIAVLELPLKFKPCKYNIFIFSIVGIISNIISLVSTYIAYYNFKHKAK